jgi:hypothetical protein
MENNIQPLYRWVADGEIPKLMPQNWLFVPALNCWLEPLTPTPAHPVEDVTAEKLRSIISNYFKVKPVEHFGLDCSDLAEHITASANLKRSQPVADAVDEIHRLYKTLPECPFKKHLDKWFTVTAEDLKPPTPVAEYSYKELRTHVLRMESNMRKGDYNAVITDFSSLLQRIENLRSQPVERLLPLKNALKAVDDWLKSDDTWVTDAQGNKVDGGLICCKPGALLNRMIGEMSKRDSIERLSDEEIERIAISFSSKHEITIHQRVAYNAIKAALQSRRVDTGYLSNEEREELNGLQKYMDLCSMGDRPQSPSADKLQRYLYLKQKAALQTPQPVTDK